MFRASVSPCEKRNYDEGCYGPSTTRPIPSFMNAVPGRNLPDGHPSGEPIVANGLTLCKLHHAAYDRHILGVRADYVVEIQRDILEERYGTFRKAG